MAKLRYKTGYKYQLVNDLIVQTDIFPDIDIETEFLGLTRSGILTIRHGYAWDGPSGPTFDTTNFMRGSCAHDALAQLVRDYYLDKKWFTKINLTLKRLCLEDGMWKIRALWVFIGVEYLTDKKWCCPGCDGGKKLMEVPDDNRLIIL